MEAQLWRSSEAQLGGPVAVPGAPALPEVWVPAPIVARTSRLRGLASAVTPGPPAEASGRVHPGAVALEGSLLTTSSWQRHRGAAPSPLSPPALLGVAPSRQEWAPRPATITSIATAHPARLPSPAPRQSPTQQDSRATPAPPTAPAQSE